jgi:recombination protein RecR
MDLRPRAVRQLLEHLQRLPGVGPRSARRMAEHLLVMPAESVAAFATAVAELRERVRLCSVCSALTESDPCPVCSDPNRDQTTILVVESPTTVWTVEETGEFNGLYHVLLGHLSPLHGVGPEELTIEALVSRVHSADPPVHEIILATDPTVEGETTALYIQRQLGSTEARLSRPALGIPIGGELGAVDQVTLSQALTLRRALSS